MKRNTLNLVIDVVTLLNLLFLVVSGYLMEFTLPPREGAGVQRTLWGLDRHDWGDWHFWAAVLFVVLMLLHVALHWKWVCATIGRMVQRADQRHAVAPLAARNVYGGVFLTSVLALVVGFVWWADASVVEEARGHGGQRTALVDQEGGYNAAQRGASGRRGDEDGSFRIRGGTTLAEIESAIGIAPEEICFALGWPMDTPANSSLNDLRGEHGLSMADVRSTIESLWGERSHP